MNLRKNVKKENTLSRVTEVVLVTALTITALVGVFFFGPQAEAGENAGTLDFRACTELALSQSPYLTSSALEIRVRHLDVLDSWWTFVPTVNLTAQYALFRPKATTAAQENRRDYSISFATGSYNPIASFFSVKARELIKDIAIMAHLQVVNKGIHELAEKLLKLEMLHRMTARQDKAVALARQHLGYVKKLKSTGTASLLQVQMAAQRLAVVQAGSEKLSAKKSTILEGLKFSLGLKPIQRLDLNLKETRRQILGPFDPKAATLEQARSHSFELKIQKLKEELQDWNIILSYAKYMPTITFGVRTTDLAQETVEGQQEYFGYVGAAMPLWDGFSRYRDVSRQKKIMKQVEAQGDVQKADFRLKWRAANKALQQAEIDMELARTSEELAFLEEQQSEIRYKSSELPLPKLLESRAKHLEAQKSTLSKVQEYEVAVLKIRHLSGDLFNRYVNVEPWKE